MEEKKTKKMTKAEAFEWLDGKKILTEGNHEKVLRKLFDLGFVWKCLRDTRIDLGWQPGEVYGLTISGDEVAWWATPRLFDTHGVEQVSPDDILSIEIVEENRSEEELVEIVELGKKIQCLLPKLSGHRHVVITETDILLCDEGMCLFHSDPF